MESIGFTAGGKGKLEYEVKDSPLVHGILYADSESMIAETIWYKTKEERDEAVKVLLEEGEIPAGTLFSNREKMIKPLSFSKIEAEGKYYRFKR